MNYKKLHNLPLHLSPNPWPPKCNIALIILLNFFSPCLIVFFCSSKSAHACSQLPTTVLALPLCLR